MKIEIEINEEDINKIVAEKVAEEFAKTARSNMELRGGIRQGIDKFVSNYLYSRKDKIIEKVIDRASREIVKKGLPKLIDKVCEDIK